MNMISSASKRTHIISEKAVILLLLIGLPWTAAAESWQLQTAVEEVPGTRDIEAGQVDKGIRVLQWYLKAAPVRQKGVVLTNLCMAYILKREYEKAAGYCDHAVARDRPPKVAYNNRGVLRALQGDYTGALNDFRKAGCLRDCPAKLTIPGSLPMMVARQNLSRAEQQWAVMQRRLENERVSQQNDK